MIAMLLTTAPAVAETAEDSRGGATVREPEARTTDAALVDRPTFVDVPCRRFTDSIVRLYSAYFLRAPDRGGFEFWQAEYEAGRWSLPRMSNFFSQSPEFQQRYGALTNAEFIDLIYRNIFGRPADTGGRDFWLGRMQNDGLDRGTVMLNFSESPEYVELTRSLRPGAGYFNWYPDSTRFTCGFDDTEYPVLVQPAWIDVLVFNTEESPIVIRFEVLQAGTWTLVQESTLNSGGSLRAFGWGLNGNLITRLRLTSPTSFSWSIAHSPTITPPTRAGW